MRRPRDWIVLGNGADERLLGDELYDTALLRLREIGDHVLAGTLAARGEDLRRDALALVARDGGLRHGSDYVIAAEPLAA